MTALHRKIAFETRFEYRPARCGFDAVGYQSLLLQEVVLVLIKESKRCWQMAPHKCLLFNISSISSIGHWNKALQRQSKLNVSILRLVVSRSVLTLASGAVVLARD